MAVGKIPVYVTKETRVWPAFWITLSATIITLTIYGWILFSGRGRPVDLGTGTICVACLSYAWREALKLIGVLPMYRRRKD